MTYLGDMTLGSTINFKFTTVGTSGLPTNLAATTSTTISIYPSNSTTQITAGATLTTDFDSITGLNAVSIALTGGNGFAVATDYSVVLATGTVGGTNVLGYVVGDFSVQNRNTILAAQSINSASFSAGAITSTTFTTGAIGGTTFIANAIGATTFASGAIVATTYAAGAITSTVIAAGAITSTTFTTGAIAATTFIAGAITSTVLAAGTITSTTFTTGSIAATTFISGSIVATTFAAGAITSSVLAAGALTSTKFTTGAIAATTFISGSIVATTFASGAITSTVLAAGAITSTTFTTASIVGTTFAANSLLSTTFDPGTGLQPVRSAIASAATGTSISFDSGASATTDFYKNEIVYITGGIGAGQARFITAYDGSIQKATVATWATNPTSTSTFSILPADAITAAITAPTASEVATAVWDSLHSDHVGAGTFGSYSNLTTGAINSATFSAGAITSTTFTTGSIAATTFVSGAITSTILASGAITSATITNDAITDNPVASVVGAVGSVAADVSITSNVKKNSARTGFMLVMTDALTHAPTAGYTVTSTRSIDGGAYSATTNSVSEVGVGTYTIDLSAADVNGNHIMLRFVASGADDLNIEIITQP